MLKKVADDEVEVNVTALKFQKKLKLCWEFSLCN